MASDRISAAQLTSWMATVCAAVAGLSGMGLSWHYVPDPSHAHASILSLQASSYIGLQLRALHSHSAHACMALTVAHLIVVLARRRAGPDAYRLWTAGIAAALIAMAVSFTGRVLPWDQHAGVSLTVAGAFMRVGSTDWVLALLGFPQLALQRLLVLHVIGSIGLGWGVGCHWAAPWARCWFSSLCRWFNTRSLGRSMRPRGPPSRSFRNGTCDGSSS